MDMCVRVLGTEAGVIWRMWGALSVNGGDTGGDFGGVNGLTRGPWCMSGRNFSRSRVILEMTRGNQSVLGKFGSAIGSVWG